MDKKTKKSITEAYEFYIKTISSKGHAASLELSLYLMDFLQRTKPATIADLGSGFTSYVCRFYQKQFAPKTTVVSVDDNPIWLDKTQAFLREHRVSLEGLMLWFDFRTTDRRFDFIFYDLGQIPTRIACIEEVFGLLTESGEVLLDDAQFDKAYSIKNRIYSEPYLADVIDETIKHFGYTKTVIKETVDNYGRYSVLATKRIA